jgi:hypothetical protein
VKPRFFFYVLGLLMIAVIFRAAAVNGADDPPPPDPYPLEIQGKDVGQWHAIAARYRRKLLVRWKPTVQYAYRLAAAVYGVSYGQLHAVSGCESNHYVFARNGQYRGLFQEGPMFERGPFGRAGFSVWDPVANALTAASVVSRQGWRQWSCRP